MADVRWYGNQVEATIRAELARRLEAACIVVENQVKKNLSTPGTAPRRGRGPTGSGKLGGRKRGRIYGASRSSPGEYPYKQTGILRASYGHEVDAATLTGRVGSSYKVALYLEVGTRKMAARPHLRPSLAECQGQINRILGKPIAR